jgi:hypothetical protein
MIIQYRRIIDNEDKDKPLVREENVQRLHLRWHLPRFRSCVLVRNFAFLSFSNRLLDKPLLADEGLLINDTQDGANF